MACGSGRLGEALARWFAVVISTTAVSCTTAEMSAKRGEHDASPTAEWTVGNDASVADASPPGECGAECPEYWLCEMQEDGGGTLCAEPKPDYPDNGQEWRCEDVDGATVCIGQVIPSEAGDDGWTCTDEGAQVECVNPEPDYPTEPPSEGGWSCFYRGDGARVCQTNESGDGTTAAEPSPWRCYDGPAGRECQLPMPSFPDDQSWSCFDSEGNTVCTAPGEVPADPTDGWICEAGQDMVTCRSDAPEYPDEPSDTGWACAYQGEVRVCRAGTDPEAGGTTCTPGAQRWCDDPVYCSWGKSECLAEGVWGPCVEPTLSNESGIGDRPDNACGCRYFYFNEACCEDQIDADGDGHPDCIIPEDHQAPACASDGNHCDYCNTHNDCGGGNDLCIFTRTGATFCGGACSDNGDCPAGSTCQTIRTNDGEVRQCIPDDENCD